MKTIHFLRTNNNGPRKIHSYCHFQIHAVYMQSCYNKVSKCPPFTVKQDALFLLEILAR